MKRKLENYPQKRPNFDVDLFTILGMQIRIFFSISWTRIVTVLGRY